MKEKHEKIAVKPRKREHRNTHLYIFFLFFFFIVWKSHGLYFSY
jgi:hypothetical protein